MWSEIENCWKKSRSSYVRNPRHRIELIKFDFSANLESERRIILLFTNSFITLCSILLHSLLYSYIIRDWKLLIKLRWKYAFNNLVNQVKNPGYKCSVESLKFDFPISYEFKKRIILFLLGIITHRVIFCAII